MLINILALIWGALMIINIALWIDRSCSATSAATVARLTNPFDQRVPVVVNGAAARRPAGLPLFEAIVGLLLGPRRSSTTSSPSAAGATDVQVEADAVTGEAMIG